VVVLSVVAILSNAQSPNERLKTAEGKEGAIRSAIASFAKELNSIEVPLAVAARGPGGSVTTPSACGKKFTAAEMLTTGANISVGAHATVSEPAEDGIYKFYLYIKVTDDAGNVVREATTTGKASKGIDGDFGYIETIKKCYCDATKLHIEIALASISPSDKFALHQFEECDFEITASP
jgi:hypothetical protein